MIDWQGPVAVIGAIGAFIAVVTTPILQILAYRDQRREKKLAAQERINAARREQKLDKVSRNVDGLNIAAVAMGVRAGTAEGKQQERTEERDRQEDPQK